MADVKLAQVFQTLGDQAIYEYDQQVPTLAHVVLIKIDTSRPQDKALRENQFQIIARNGTMRTKSSPREGMCKNYKHGDGIDDWEPSSQRKRKTFQIHKQNHSNKQQQMPLQQSSFTVSAIDGNFDLAALASAASAMMVVDNNGNSNENGGNHNSSTNTTTATTAMINEIGFVGHSNLNGGSSSDDMMMMEAEYSNVNVNAPRKRIHKQ